MRRGAGGGGRLIIPPPPRRPPRPMLFLAVWNTAVVIAALCRAARSPQRRRRGLSDEDRHATRARGIGRWLCASDLEQLITLVTNLACVRRASSAQLGWRGFLVPYITLASFAARQRFCGSGGHRVSPRAVLAFVRRAAYRCAPEPRRPSPRESLKARANKHCLRLPPAAALLLE